MTRCRRFVPTLVKLLERCQICLLRHTRSSLGPMPLLVSAIIDPAIDRFVHVIVVVCARNDECRTSQALTLTLKLSQVSRPTRRRIGHLCSSPRRISWLVLKKLECGPMPNLMVALPNIGGTRCSTPQSLADAHY